jgi:hypothetical protein
MQEERSRIPTIGSIAIMCPACWRGDMAAGPDGIRDPAPNKPAASKAVDPDGFSRSSVRPMVISLRSHTLASTRGSGGDRLLPVCLATRPRGPFRTGHLVDQSRPKPRGGSGFAPAGHGGFANRWTRHGFTPQHDVTQPARAGQAGRFRRFSALPSIGGPSCWPGPRPPPCAAGGAAG